MSNLYKKIKTPVLTAIVGATLMGCGGGPGRLLSNINHYDDKSLLGTFQTHPNRATACSDWVDYLESQGEYSKLKLDEILPKQNLDYNACNVRKNGYERAINGILTGVVVAACGLQIANGGGLCYKIFTTQTSTSAATANPSVVGKGGGTVINGNFIAAAGGANGGGGAILPNAVTAAPVATTAATFNTNALVLTGVGASLGAAYIANSNDPYTISNK